MAVPFKLSSHPFLLLSARICATGFHLYRRELDNMPNPAEAYARRGSHWTFAAERFVSAVASLKHKGEDILHQLLAGRMQTLSCLTS